MGETAILHTTAIEVFALVAVECQCRAVGSNLGRRALTDHDLAVAQVGNLHQARGLIEFHLHSRRGDGNLITFAIHLKFAHILTRLANKNLSRRIACRITKNAAFRIAKHTEDVLAVEIERQHLTIAIGNLDRGGIYFPNTTNRKVTGKHSVSRRQHESCQEQTKRFMKIHIILFINVSK